MARASMAQLINRVRLLIDDPVGDQAQFADGAIQDALDVHRSEMRFVPLRPMPTFQPGGTTVFLDYYSDSQNWEADVLLQDTGYNTIQATTSELLVGHWQFAAQPAGIGVRATGKTYDVYDAAADLLDMWAGAVKLRASFSTDLEKFNLAEVSANLLALATRYRGQSQVHISRMTQSDVAPDIDGGSIVYPDYASW